MLAVNPKYLADAGTSRNLLAGAIGLAGPYDFLPITGPTVRKIFAPGDDGPLTQPITYVDGHAPPLLLLAGSADETVRPRNTTSMAARVAGAGGKVVSKIYPDVGHIGLILAIAPLFQGKAPVVTDVETFIAANARP
jgi:acetyl esterase/lipase